MLFETRAHANASAESSRRLALIRATQALVAEGGPEAATVRAIAARAGVTQGLIRHYFGSKDALVRAAYAALMEAMTEKGLDALEGVGAEPEERLAAFVAAALRPPVLDGRAVGLWAGYLHRVQADPGLLDQHEQGYLGFRAVLERLIAALPRPAPSPTRLRQEAIACNAVIDGLWLEGSILQDRFGPGEIIRIGLRAVGAILGADLFRHPTFIPEITLASPDERPPAGEMP